MRTLPKVLKYLPSDKAQDARSFIMSFQYWLGGSPDNIESMLLMLANTYVEEVKDTKSVIAADIAEPVLLPDKGIWHPIADKVRGSRAGQAGWGGGT